MGEKRTKRQKTPAGIYTKHGVKTLPKKEITINGNNAYVSKCIHIILEEKNQEKNIKYVTGVTEHVT